MRHPFSSNRVLDCRSGSLQWSQQLSARTKGNDEMKRTRECRRLGEAEIGTGYNNPSICVSDDRTVEELNVGIAGCLLLARKQPRQRRMSW